MGALAIASGGLLFASACDDDEGGSPTAEAQTENDLLARALRAHFPYLEFDDDVITAFA